MNRKNVMGELYIDFAISLLPDLDIMFKAKTYIP